MVTHFFFLMMDEIYINKSDSLLLHIFMYAYQQVEMNMTIVFVIVWPLFSSVANNCIYNIKGDLLCPFCNRNLLNMSFSYQNTPQIICYTF